MLEWLYAVGFVLICIAAAVDAQTRHVLAKRLVRQERRKAAPKHRQQQNYL